ncbi:D-aminoacyl-tRNA deacylase [Alienimonas chondri]|uniref:D-aminoacyl-tRNA deacylase n=1 Tax=Alienimonas chondri TaxID=2681879 RepID=A0ABX1V9S0_9PLAN|nr:D-aminoacyl-tRNA deacylase [Alienimonas chondri]NNJ24499.1 D-aminoacyl-tRNA deacylase [Alienimonas chondri]
MRAVVQRVSDASVTVEGTVVGEIGRGLLVLLGVEEGDGEADLKWLAAKVAGLRIFKDAEGKMNRSVTELVRDRAADDAQPPAGVLVVSQFTLLGDCRTGRRPSFKTAAEPGEADRLYQAFCERLRAEGLFVATGVFRATMAVSLTNDGPVTLLVDSRKQF